MRVCVLDDDADLRGLISEILAAILGEPCCIALGSYAELLEHQREVLETRMAIIDINLGAGGKSGLDAHRWLLAQGYHGTTVFLTGHAESHPLVVEALRSGRARVLSKPIRVERFRELVQEHVLSAG